MRTCPNCRAQVRVLIHNAATPLKRFCHHCLPDERRILFGKEIYSLPQTEEEKRQWEEIKLELLTPVSRWIN